MSHGRSHALPLPSTRLRACAHAPQAGRAVAPRPPQLVRLGEVCEIVSGSTPKTSVESYWGGLFPWITPAELNDETVVIVDTARHLTEEGVASAALKPFPAGTVLLSSRAPIGKVAIAGCNMYCNQGFKNLICSDIIHNFYLYYWLKSHTAFLNSLGRGATFKEISKAIVAQIQIPLPPLADQKRIAAILDKICEMKRNAEARLQKLDLLVKARFVEMFGDVASSSSKYQFVTMAEVASVGSSRRIFQGEYVSEGVPFYRTKEIVELSHGKPISVELYISQARYSEIKARYGVPMKGDLLVSAVGTIGEIWIVDGVREFYFKDGNLMQIRARGSLDPVYLRQCLKTLIQHFKATIPSGTAYAALTIDSVKKMKLPLPPLALQRQFAAFVEKVEGLKATAKKELEQVDLLYRAKLQEYFG